MANSTRRGRPLKDAADKIAHKTQLNLTEREYREVMADYDKRTYRTKTAYLRARVLDKSITVRTVNANLETLEQALVSTVEELNRVGVNVNQLAKHLNTYKTPAQKSEVLQLLKLFVKVQALTETIKDTVHEIDDKW